MKKKTLKSVNKKQSDKDYTDLHKKLKVLWYNIDYKRFVLSNS